MKLSLGLFLFAVVFSVSAQKQSNITIKGKLINNTFKTIYLDKFSNEPIPMDSAKIVNDAFEFHSTIPESGFYDLRLAGDKMMILVLTPGDKIELSGNAYAFQIPFSFSGSKQSGMVFELGTKIGNYDMKKDSLNQVYEKVKNTTFRDSVVVMLKAAFDDFSGKQNDLVINFIDKNPSSLGGLLFISRLPINDNMLLYSKYDSALFKAYPQNSFVKEFHSQVVKNTRLSIGSVAPDIIEKDTTGKEIPLSSLRGKIVLIDFWASWCGPCRRESPNMVKLYNKFRDKGFEIYSVSLDKDRQAWLNAIKKDKLRWTHVSDLGFWNAKPAQLYNISSIPSTVLLDRNGKIIAKGLMGGELDQKLDEIFVK